MMTSTIRTFLSLSLSCLALSQWAGAVDVNGQLMQTAENACAMFDGGVCAQENSVDVDYGDASPVAETPSGDGIPKITGNLSIKEPPSPKENSFRRGLRVVDRDNVIDGVLSLGLGGALLANPLTGPSWATFLGVVGGMSIIVGLLAGDSRTREERIVAGAMVGVGALLLSSAAPFVIGASLIVGGLVGIASGIAR